MLVPFDFSRLKEDHFSANNFNAVSMVAAAPDGFAGANSGSLPLFLTVSSPNDSNESSGGCAMLHWVSHGSRGRFGFADHCLDECFNSVFPHFI